MFNYVLLPYVVFMRGKQSLKAENVCPSFLLVHLVPSNYKVVFKIMIQ